MEAKNGEEKSERRRQKNDSKRDGYERAPFHFVVSFHSGVKSPLRSRLFHPASRPEHGDIADASQPIGRIVTQGAIIPIGSAQPGSSRVRAERFHIPPAGTAALGGNRHRLVALSEGWKVRPIIAANRASIPLVAWSQRQVAIPRPLRVAFRLLTVLLVRRRKCIVGHARHVGNGRR